MTLRSLRIDPSDFQTEISTGSPEFSMVRAVDMCIERAIALGTKYELKVTRLGVYNVVGRCEYAG